MGKISVKHYLNKKFKPYYNNDDNKPNENDLPEYPLYYYITINRKSIHKPSYIYGTFTEDDLANNCIVHNGGNETLFELIKREINMITKICDIYIDDVNNREVQTGFKNLFSAKSFSSNSELVNNINSYICYYTQSINTLVNKYIEKEIKSHLYDKIKATFDLSMYSDIGTPAIKFELQGSYLMETEFYRKNIPINLFRLHCLRLYLHGCLGFTNIKYSYDLPLIEWIRGTLKTEILAHISKYTPRQITDSEKITNDEFTNIFIPIIDKICSSEYQINKKRQYK